MGYVPHTPDEIRHMLGRIGVPSVDALFETIPESLRSKAGLDLGEAAAERTLIAELRERAAQNLGTSSATCFLGAGAYAHFIPAAVDALASRGEFTTAYTPYQAEISQGTLQAVYEFQTLICQLAGLDVANASLYDGASATAEAALMAMRVRRRQRVLLSAGLHPHWAHVVRTYLDGLGAQVDVLPTGPDGRTLPAKIDDDVAAVVIQYPNFLGCVEDLASFSEAAHASKALLVSATAEPLALAVLQAPGALGADVACGEAQSFGVPLSFGGPQVGFLAARQELVRQLPGRLIGETVDSGGQRAFVMTLTTREQHIRRERATSNICTNQGLCALRVAIYLALLGRRGLRKLALANLSLAQYARGALSDAGLELPYSAPVFNEFVVRGPGLGERHAALLERGLVAGLHLGPYDATLRDHLLICTTELVGRDDIDRLARELSA
ncbi:MAG: aminomethyl-transferring glycine dehydrogenase subunit GcvPA [Deltaproteobacteria bacterium]|nr:aminomethyl-transferring glycine dehydrogenase subunit GcvPA [Deltaproteobacteria bacterium]